MDNKSSTKRYACMCMCVCMCVHACMLCREGELLEVIYVLFCILLYVAAKRTNAHSAMYRCGMFQSTCVVLFTA